MRKDYKVYALLANGTIVVGSEMIVFDDEGFKPPVQEQIELGYFNLMPE